jgi:hypothetical protein
VLRVEADTLAEDLDLTPSGRGGTLDTVQCPVDKIVRLPCRDCADSEEHVRVAGDDVCGPLLAALDGGVDTVRVANLLPEESEVAVGGNGRIESVDSLVRLGLEFMSVELRADGAGFVVHIQWRGRSVL